MKRAMMLIVGYWIIFTALGAAVVLLPTTPWWWATWIIYGLWGCIYVYYECITRRCIRNCRSSSTCSHGPYYGLTWRS